MICKITKNSRIYFTGSSAWIEDAVWIDNDRFILAGIHSDEQSQRIPYIIIGSIKGKFRLIIVQVRLVYRL
ncbi:hypothetical protein [Elizabethkingia anophelis]|uniref:hypothetical protein n=1 Tax=Elizabethkingia anophelis TaxID=1117645 RepID=UPI000AABF699|nr:hypothetical protein [Elizabethkingia anophelis]